jgi:hypothetical protein
MGDGLADDQLDNLAIDYFRDHGLNRNTVTGHVQADDAGGFGVNDVNRQDIRFKQEIKMGDGRFLKNASFPVTFICSLNR